MLSDAPIVPKAKSKHVAPSPPLMLGTKVERFCEAVQEAGALLPESQGAPSKGVGRRTSQEFPCQ